MKSASTVDEDTDYLLGLIARRSGRLLWKRDRDGRWYQALILVDLFDNTEIRLNWGGPLRSRSGSTTLAIEGIEDSTRRALLRSLCQRRLWHGYVRVLDS